MYSLFTPGINIVALFDLITSEALSTSGHTWNVFQVTTFNQLSLPAPYAN